MIIGVRDNKVPLAVQCDICRIMEFAFAAPFLSDRPDPFPFWIKHLDSAIAELRDIDSSLGVNGESGGNVELSSLLSKAAPSEQVFPLRLEGFYPIESVIADVDRPIRGHRDVDRLLELTGTLSRFAYLHHDSPFRVKLLNSLIA